MYNPYTSYKQNQVENASQEDILLQLVQGALVRIKQARHLWDQDRKREAREKRVRAMDIVVYLDNTLDRENGGEIAEELDALYAYMIREMTAAATKDDFERLAPVQEVLETLYEAWKDAVAEYKKTKNGSAGMQEKVTAGTGAEQGRQALSG
jgi:flagellar protein FliS